MKKWTVLLGLMAAVLAGCKQAAVAPVVVFAAAGTAPAMKEMAAQFEKETGVPVVFNLANAGVLAKQLAEGAPADLFFSANEKWMDFAADKNVIQPETRRVLLTDQMVVIVPKGHAVAQDFTQPCSGPFVGRFAMGDGVTPLGIYAEQALSKLGWWDVLKPHMCIGDTVQKVLNYVALNEADAGIVFHSVASCSAAKVDEVGVIPASLHKPIRFPAAACVGASDSGLAFLEFMKSAKGSAIFEKFGWTVFAETERDHV
jgi:molybdate transport system substrate-binding protein